MALFFVGVWSYDDLDDIPSLLDTIMTIGLFGNWIGGLAHAFIIRNSVFRPAYGAQPMPYGSPYAPPQMPPQHLSAQHPSGQHSPQRQAPQHSSPQYPAAQHPSGQHPSLRHPPASPPLGPTPIVSTQPRPGGDSRFTSPGSTTPAPWSNRPGQPEWFGHYRVIGSLGKGGQGSVYLALTPQGQKVAIKVLHDHIAEDAAAQSRFLREVDAARRVAPFSTARVLDVSGTRDQAYVVSEYVDGASLEQLVREQGPRTEDGLTRLALATSGALAAIHKAGIVHRDFKPSNVLIGSDGPRVIDFGIARALDQVTSTSSQIMGTPAYMSPEQLAGRQVGPETDVFSWAATMIFAATGRAAFGDDTIPAILNRIINHQPDLTALPPSLRSLAASCLEKDPENRPSASDVMLAIVQ
jgi:predicted Ser/Thr protein kinase